MNPTRAYAMAMDFYKWFNMIEFFLNYVLLKNMDSHQWVKKLWAERNILPPPKSLPYLHEQRVLTIYMYFYPDILRQLEAHVFHIDGIQRSLKRFAGWEFLYKDIILNIHIFDNHTSFEKCFKRYMFDWSLSFEVL